LGKLRLTSAAVVLVVANLTDAIITLTLLELAVVRELNPLMRWAYELSPLVFVLSKLTMVQAGLLLAALQRPSWAMPFVSRSGALLYTGVVIYQAFLIAKLQFSA
jgi:hypothetical protein